ncbi:MAG TPA: FecR domain-containing protein [Candidatus Lustribacter sp.]|nr:FecR domain-containing protein [Candidatus Lustribacter sp.]
MHLTGVDIFVIAAFFAVNLGIGVYFASRTKDVGDFFVSGGKAPWWLTGTSMVATTFAVDTPLAVTGFVAANGIAGNWLWWNMAASGLLTVFFFAALWRRSGVLTDVEFIELRYGGQAATWLRGVRAVYQGVIVNTIIMGWVNLAMVKVLSLTLHVPTMPALYICLVLTALYVTIGGLWSVLVTDMLQFIVKMSMAIVLAIAAVVAVGGIGALKTKLAVVDAAHHASGGGSLLSFFPTGDASWMPLTTFLVFIGVSWWASSYPGAEPGGGSYIAQRIFASKDEKNAVMATLFFNVAHYALRPWPWILVALCALVLYPHGVIGADGKVDAELGYVQTLVDYLPPSLRGLMLAGFAAAYMSTIGTQLNLGASYLTNDLYRRFIRPVASEHHYVAVSRVMTVVCLILAAAITPLMHSVGDAWKYMLTMTAGVGLVMILRWYWWRISAWSEISALAISAVVGSGLYLFNVVAGDDPNATAKRLLITVVLTTVGWMAVTFATQPETDATLVRFFDRVRPDDFGWKRIARLVPPAARGESLGLALVDWLAGLGLVFGTLFAIGDFVLAEPVPGTAFAILALLCGALILRHLNTPVLRTATATALALLLAIVPLTARSDDDKVLTNVKGAVSYERDGTPHSLVPKVKQLLTDQDVAVTQTASLAQVALPDSSLVTLGAQTRVQLAFFNQTDIANAKFIVYQGKTRFLVAHPQGAAANYTFQTPTTQIAVRGTEGDIEVDQNNLTLNVYNSSQPDGVAVTYTAGNLAGTTVKVLPGQSLVANLVNGIIQASVNKITQAALNEFSELGVPTSVSGAEGTVINKVKSAIHLPF